MPIDEINRYIHVEIMGKCWHDNLVDDGYAVTCLLCKDERPSPKGNNHFLFERSSYTSDASPRSLLNEVVAKVIEIDYATFASNLVRTANNGDVLAMLNPTAEQIARACVEAHKTEEQK